MNLAVKEIFEGNEMDVYQNDQGEVYMTREQIGRALEYANPKEAIKNIHSRNRTRLDRFSTGAQIDTPSRGIQETTIYNEKGIYEIIRHSKQPKADAFYDWVYDLLSKLRKGEYQITQPHSEKDKLQIQKQRAEAMLLNARTRQAKLILDMQKNKTLSPVAVELLQINALETLTDQQTKHRPQIEEKHFTATEVGKELGVTANKVGRVAKAYDVKTEEFGMWVLDKSPHSSKQVHNFLYNQKGKERIQEILQGE